MPVFAGIDIGSATTKTVILDDTSTVLASNIVPTGGNSRGACDRCLETSLAEAGICREDLVYVIATGYGREIVDFADATITEISCHAKGVHIVLPETRTILDIGGQDSKAIRNDEESRVVDFAMNDKCAAGTGRFLEVMARTLEIDLPEMGPLSLQSTNQVTVSSMCTVFAESEVVSLIAGGHDIPDILSGIHRAISDRTVSLLERVRWESKVAFTGGVAKNVGVVHALEKRLGVKLNIPEEPQITGALGAAAFARERYADSQQ